MSEQQVVKHDGIKAEEASLIPPVDVVEDASGITLYADMPGVKKGDLNIHVDGENVTIEGKISLNMPVGIASLHTEIGLPSYKRVFALSRELDSQNTSAEFANGVLKLRIPKAEHAQPKRITVQAA